MTDRVTELYEVELRGKGSGTGPDGPRLERREAVSLEGALRAAQQLAVGRGGLGVSEALELAQIWREAAQERPRERGELAWSFLHQGGSPDYLPLEPDEVAPTLTLTRLRVAERGSHELLTGKPESDLAALRRESQEAERARLEAQVAEAAEAAGPAFGVSGTHAEKLSAGPSGPSALELLAQAEALTLGALGALSPEAEGLAARAEELLGEALSAEREALEAVTVKVSARDARSCAELLGSLARGQRVGSFDPGLLREAAGRVAAALHEAGWAQAAARDLEAPDEEE